MVDRQDLVPDNLPYGERQNTVDAMQNAGLPTASTGGPSLMPSPGPVGGSAPIGGPGPGMDFLDEVDPAAIREPGPQPSVDPVVNQYLNWQQIAQNSPNTVMRAVANRVLNELADKIELSQDPWAKYKTDRPAPTVQQMLGMDPNVDDSAASEHLDVQMERLARLSGQLTPTMWNKMFTDDNEFNLETISTGLEGVGAGVHGITNAFSLGVQTGRYVSGNLDLTEVRRRIANTWAGIKADARLGAYFAGVLAGYQDIGQINTGGAVKRSDKPFSGVGVVPPDSTRPPDFGGEGPFPEGVDFNPDDMPKMHEDGG